MHNKATIKTLTLNQFAEIVKMIKFLLNAGLITKEEADITADRIASEYKLSKIYIL